MLKRLLLPFLFFSVISLHANAQCAVTIYAQGPTSFCQGDSVALFAFATGASGTLLDQSFLNYNSGTSARNLPGYAYWQSFTAGKTGTLSQIDVGFFTPINGTCYFTVWQGTGTQGTLLDSQAVAIYCSGGNCMISFSMNIPVTAGAVYTYQVRGGPGMPDPYGLQMGVPGTYAGGQCAFVDPSGTSYPGFDMVFDTYVTTYGTVSYQWNTGATDSVIAVSTSGIYSCNISTSGGCTANDVIAITVNPAVQVDLGPDTPICSGCTVTLQADTGYYSYYWSTGATTSSINTGIPGVYFVTVTSSHGCVGSDTIVVSINTFIEETQQNSFFVTVSNRSAVVRYNELLEGTLHFDLYDISGRILHTPEYYSVEKGLIELDLSEFVSGNYFLRTSGKTSCITTKFILQ